MSCYFAIRFDDRIEMMTDGAVFNIEGRFVRDKNKSGVALFAPVAVAGVGEEPDIEVMTEVVLTAAFFLSSVDEMIEVLGEELPKFEPTIGASAIVIACISETRGPLILTYKNTEDRLVNRGDSHAFGPGLDIDEMLATGVDFSFPDGLRSDGVQLLKAMRAKPCEQFAGLPLGHYVGGHIDWTVVDRNGARVERVLDWDDVPGQPIEVGERESLLSSRCHARRTPSVESMREAQRRDVEVTSMLLEGVMRKHSNKD
ncbi:hypothetical protein [Pelagibacterium lentulum]|uniref:Uncharacterized protein n=1 Tax=Pelagibacterium lentulum TaxID=2029865 RepID=A0A916RAN8_9HYPH|nr:hypothetical protein [Pelagibacterium lentulum]GGA47261.1 hypothetical protein GCM10011499_16300 [Pelagibacterium lentulum]